MASSTNPGGDSGTSRFIPPILNTPITLDLFSRSLQLMLGRDLPPPEQPPVEKIQPVVPSLYPQEAPPAAPQPVAPAMRFDPRTKALLVELCSSSQSGGNVELGEALLQCEQPPMTNQALSRYRAVLQRVTLVARMIESVETDPSVPAPFARAFDRLRFTLIKSALADANFFSQRWHPLRAIAASLAMRATSAPASDASAQRECVTALDEAVRDFNLSASFVRPIVNRLQPLPVETMKAFAQQLLNERSEREEAVHAQRQVDQEIASRVRGAVLDDRLRFVVEAWKAVLIRQWTRYGSDSAEWVSCISVVEQLLALAPGIQAGAGVPRSLLERIESGLLDAGRPFEPVMRTLEEVRKEPTAPDGAAADGARAALQLSPLKELMAADRWFRVFDHAQQRMRWLKAQAFDAGRNTVSFSEMDGSNALVLHATQFLEDLRRGLSAPNSPEPEVAELIAKLRAEPA